MVSDFHKPGHQAPLNATLEINDFGYPQNSEIDTLKSYITTESIVSASIAAVSVKGIMPCSFWFLMDTTGRILQDHHTGDRCDELATCRC